MNKLMLVLVCLSLTIPGLTMARDIVKPSEPHGVVATTAGMPGQDLYEARIRSINGQQINPIHEKAVWLRPGTHEIRVTQPAVNVGRATGLGRQSLPPRRADGSANMTIELQVEEGMIYYLAVDGSPPQIRDWKVVVSHTKTR